MVFVDPYFAWYTGIGEMDLIMSELEIWYAWNIDAVYTAKYRCVNEK